MVANLGDSRIDNLSTTDKAGLVRWWTLPNQRGYAFSLDPQFPLSKQTHVLLKCLATTYGLRIPSDMCAAERIAPKTNKTYNVDLLFGSSVKTRTLAALECLGGKSPPAVLRQAVPDELTSSAKNAIRNLTLEGVLVKAGGQITFAKAPWLPQLRALLRAYASYSSGFKSEVRRLVTERRSVKNDMFDLDLLGKFASERILTALATKGAISPDKLHTIARVHDKTRLLGRFVKAGIVAKNGYRNGARVSLNRAHPVYREIRALLLAVGGPRDRKAAPDLSMPLPVYDLYHLFCTKPRFNALFAMAIYGWIDATSITMLNSEHDRGNMGLVLANLKRLGIVESCRVGNMLYYRLDQRYKFHLPLLRLLRAAAKANPARRADIEGLPDLYDHVQELFRRSRPKK
jgi:hypothetical protein